VYKDVSPWLRYVLWLATLGFIVLGASLLQQVPIDKTKVFICGIGLCLFLASGFLLVCRKYIIDTEHRMIFLEFITWNKRVTEAIPFEKVTGVDVLPVTSTYEDSAGRNCSVQEWGVVFMTNEATHVLPGVAFAEITEAKNLSAQLAMMLSAKVGMTDHVDILLAIGKKIEAIEYIRKAHRVSLAEAKRIVDKKARL